MRPGSRRPSQLWMLTTPPSQEARVALMPGFTWDQQNAYLFDIDGTLLRSRDRIHFNSFATSVQRITDSR